MTVHWPEAGTSGRPLLVGAAIVSVAGVIALFVRLGRDGNGQTGSDGCWCSFNIAGSAASVRRVNVWFTYVAIWAYQAFNAILIPVSYDLALELGGGAAFSGMLIGSMYASMTVGVLSTRMMLNTWSQPFVRVYSSVCLLSIAVFTLLTAVGADPPRHWNLSGSQRMAMLVASRFFIGLSCGILISRRMMCQQIILREDNVSYNVGVGVSTSLGIGMGPMVGSAICWVFDVTEVAARVAVPQQLSGTFWILLAAVSWACTPNTLADLLEAKLADVALGDEIVGANRGDSPRRSQEEVDLLDNARLSASKRIWWLAVYFGVERALTVSGLEVATSLILEVDCGKSSQFIGVLIGASFIVGVPILLIVTTCRSGQTLSDGTLLVALSGICVLSALFLLRLPGVWISSLIGLPPDGFMWVLLAADAFVFPTAWAAQGVVDGLAAKICFEETWYNFGNYLVVSYFTQNTARFVAPPLARYLAYTGGQDLYACFQIFILTMSFLSSMSMRSTLAVAEGKTATAYGHVASELRETAHSENSRAAMKQESRDDAG
eukprot:TRINITY_DN12831_c0_g1_i3.p1 TRINITY_DN12831_c0_g1~~TRINITY_DN12831_c0_g1_i3.p1  ORF type:complete len:576 (+),score=62.83 TRINITY_DN12831_c0_g1_i3:85-1728(+)